MHSAVTILVLLENCVLVIPYSVNPDTQHPAVLEQLPCGKSGKTRYFKYRFSALLHHILLFRNVAPHPGSHSRPCFRAVSFPLQFISPQEGAAGNGDAPCTPSPELSLRRAVTGSTLSLTDTSGSQLPAGFLSFPPGRTRARIALEIAVTRLTWGLI